MPDRVFIACDHAGLPLKQFLLPKLQEELKTIEWVDLGTNSTDSVDYPDFAKKVAERVGAKEGRGILICGSGIGMCIAANKIKGVRAAQIWDATSARLCRQHNDANICCMGSRLMGQEVALEAARIWLSTAFQGDRHQKRVDLIHKMEC